MTTHAPGDSSGYSAPANNNTPQRRKRGWVLPAILGAALIGAFSYIGCNELSSNAANGVTLAGQAPSASASASASTAPTSTPTSTLPGTHLNDLDRLNLCTTFEEPENTYIADMTSVPGPKPVIARACDKSLTAIKASDLTAKGRIGDAQDWEFPCGASLMGYKNPAPCMIKNWTLTALGGPRAPRPLEKAFMGRTVVTVVVDGVERTLYNAVVVRAHFGPENVEQVATPAQDDMLKVQQKICGSVRQKPVEEFEIRLAAVCTTRHASSGTSPKSPLTLYQTLVLVISQDNALREKVRDLEQRQLADAMWRSLAAGYGNLPANPTSTQVGTAIDQWTATASQK